MVISHIASFLDYTAVLNETLVSQGCASGKTTIPDNLQIIMKTKWSNESHKREEHCTMMPLYLNVLVLRWHATLK